MKDDFALAMERKTTSSNTQYPGQDQDRAGERLLTGNYYNDGDGLEEVISNGSTLQNGDMNSTSLDNGEEKFENEEESQLVSEVVEPSLQATDFVPDIVNEHAPIVAEMVGSLSASVAGLTAPLASQIDTQISYVTSSETYLSLSSTAESLSNIAWNRAQPFLPEDIFAPNRTANLQVAPPRPPRGAVFLHLCRRNLLMQWNDPMHTLMVYSLIFLLVIQFISAIFFLKLL
tara:strand:+ start:158 stop:850 length:693 start_codon:yes stop_codon:yes gene_type:complete